MLQIKKKKEILKLCLILDLKKTSDADDVRADSILAKLWFEIHNTVTRLTCKYGGTDANFSSREQQSSFIGFYLLEISAGRDSTFCLWPKGNYCQKAFDSFWLCDAFQKITQISHYMLRIPRLQLGASEENPDIHACHPPSPVSTVGFILSVWTMTDEWKGVLHPLPGQHCRRYSY